MILSYFITKSNGISQQTFTQRQLSNQFLADGDQFRLAHGAGISADFLGRFQEIHGDSTNIRRGWLQILVNLSPKKVGVPPRDFEPMVLLVLGRCCFQNA